MKDGSAGFGVVLGRGDGEMETMGSWARWVGV